MSECSLITLSHIHVCLSCHLHIYLLLLADYRLVFSLFSTLCPPIFVLSLQPLLTPSPSFTLPPFLLPPPFSLPSSSFPSFPPSFSLLPLSQPIFPIFSYSFYMNSTTGEIETTVILNRAQVGQFNLFATAMDSDTNPVGKQSSTVTIVITGVAEK